MTLSASLVAQFVAKAMYELFTAISQITTNLQLKPTHTYYLRVPVTQGSTRGRAKCPASGSLPRQQWGPGQGWDLLWGWLEKNLFPSSHGYFHNPVPWFFASCWPDTTLSFFTRGPLHKVAYFIKASKGESWYGKCIVSMDITILCNYGNNILSTLLYSIGL